MDPKSGNCYIYTCETSHDQISDREKQRDTEQRDGLTIGDSEIPMKQRGSDPTLYWHGCHAEQIILDLHIRGRCIKPNTTLQRTMVPELHELLCRLFSQAKTIIIEPLSHGFSNTRVVKVQPLYAEGGVGRHVVVKFGETQLIEQEHACYKKYVQYFIGDGRCTTILDYQCTTHMGGIVYSFLGTTTQHMQSFGTFYHHASIDAIRQTLDLLFRSTCRIWYANHRSLQFLNLTEDYQKHSSYTLKHLKHFLGARLPAVLDQENLTFPSLHCMQARSFHNPFHALKAMEPQIYPTYISTTHGDFNLCNILVDPSGYPWLIDFQSIGPSHILRDIATLDVVLRLEHLTSKQVTLDERLALEEALCGITNFSQLEQLKKSYSTTNPLLTKTWETIVHLRMIAHWLVEKTPSNAMNEYYAALLYITMNTLSFSSLEGEQCEHALISASLLIDLLK